ncbi:MAG: chaperone NapD [Candidatus Wallbacteria bacterium]|nr:chaperone NapD [Candidatus Wallbacteria bacterium]
MTQSRVSSLLLSTHPGRSGDVAARLAGESGVVVTRAGGDRVAVVLEARAPSEELGLFERLQALPGVASVELAYASDGTANDDTGGLSRRGFLEALAASTLALGATRAASAFPKPGHEWRPNENDVRWEKAVCRFCGTGCGVMVGLAGGKVAAVQGDRANPVNKGLLCVKGYHLPGILYGKDRLTQPLVRENGKLVPTTWDKALDLIAEKLSLAVKTHGPKSVGMYLSGQSTVFEGYAASKLMRLGLGSNNLEANARLCMASAVTGFMSTFGSDEPMGCYDDFELGDTFVLWGNNMAEMHPVLFSRILERRRNASWVQILDLGTRFTRTSGFADRYVPFAPGSDLALANGIAHVLVKENLIDRAFIDKHVVFKKGLTGLTYGLEDKYKFTDKPEPITFDDYVKFLDDYTPEKVEQLSGVPAATVIDLAHRYGDPNKGVVSLWCMGVNQHVRGTWMNNLIYNLHLLTGKICKKGSNPLSLTGQPSACGTVREVGVVANRLPADMVVTEPEHRKKAAEIWGVKEDKIPAEPGMDTVEMFRALARGDLKFLWVSTTNPFVTLPNQDRYRKAFASGDAFMVVSDVYPTETTALASVVLPSALWVEKVGMFGNTERRTQQWNKLVDPPGEAKDDLWQFVEVAKRLGHGGLFDSGKTPLQEWLFEEYRKFTLGTGKDLAPYATYVETRGLRWPVVDGRETRYRYKGGEDPYVPAGEDVKFYKNKKADGRAVVWARPFEPPAESPDKDFPFWLCTGRVLEHWHTGTMTRRVPELGSAVEKAYVELHPDDASQLGVNAGQKVKIVSRRGAIEATVKLRERSIPEKGSVFVPFFDEALLINKVTLDATCPISREPDYKKCAVRIEKV